MVCVFARNTTGPLTSLVKQVDSEIAKNEKLKSFVVVLTEDAEKTTGALKMLATEQGVKNVPLTLVANASGPSDYQIARDADVTVMMWKGGKVVVNRAYSKGKMTEADVKSIMSEIPKILGD
ncbi:MAG: hypothetical protein JWN86_2610 [Planctomycetota bacterium]|nr:hypothetical protein [Planctomycetota bacterium]